ncbi:MAG: cytochrome P450 [Actinomycetota bacterium]
MGNQIPTDFDFKDAKLADDESFWGILRTIQQSCPVLHSDAHGGYWVLTGYGEVRGATVDTESFTSALGVAGVPITTSEFRFLPVEADPPYHTVLRKLLNPYFTPAAIEPFEADIRAIAKGLMAGPRSKGKCEFVREFAEVFPAHVFFGLFLGMPVEEIQIVMPYLHAIIWEPEKALAGFEFLKDWSARMLQRRRSEPRRDDVVDALLYGTIDGRLLTEIEQQQMLIVLVNGGLETGATSYANAAHQIATQPEVAQSLRSDATKRAAAPDEFLRFEAPVVGMTRTATRDIEVGGCPIASGDRILVHFAAANRDPGVFENPDQLDFERKNLKQHLSFGVGAHHCIGAHLARMELAIVIDELLDLPGLRLAAGFDLEQRVGLHRSPTAVELEWDTAVDRA